MGEMLQLEMAFSSFLYPEHILAGLATMTAIGKSSPHEYQLLQLFKPLAHRGDINRLAALKQSLLIDALKNPTRVCLCRGCYSNSCCVSESFHKNRPFSDIGSSDGNRPRPLAIEMRQSLEVELTTNIRLGTAAVGHIVVLEGQHMSEHISGAGTV